MRKTFAVLKTTALIAALTAALIALGGLVLPTPARAEGPGDAKAAIALAAAHPAFAPLLAMHQGWTADAYFTGNPQQIWRVAFWSADGAELGWANVSLKRRRVYSVQANNILSPDKRKTGEEAALNYARGNAEVRELLGKMDAYEHWIEYHVELNAWSVFFYRWGGDVVQALIQFQSPLTFKQPKLLGIYFPNVLSNSEWAEAQRTQAITLAFEKAEIAAAVRAHEGWTAEAAQDGNGTEAGNMWIVTFKRGIGAESNVIATVSVDLAARQILSFSIAGR